MSTSHNCIICAEEFNPNDLHNVKLSEINVTRFKICEKCLNLSDPENDYQEVKNIVNGYSQVIENKFLNSRTLDLLDIINNNLGDL